MSAALPTILHVVTDPEVPSSRDVLEQYMEFLMQAAEVSGISLTVEAQPSRQRIAVIATLVCLASLYAAPATTAEDLRPRDVWRSETRAEMFAGKVLACPNPYALPLLRLGAGDDTWTRASVSGAADFSQTTSGLRFRLAGPVARIAWGHGDASVTRSYQPIAVEGDEVGGAILRVRWRGSRPDRAEVRAEFRYRGNPYESALWIRTDSFGIEAPIRWVPDPRKSGWQNLAVDVLRLGSADGLVIECRGQAGDLVEMESVELWADVWDIHARKEFTLPEERIFAARATVANNCDLWVNGQPVHRAAHLSGTSRYQYAPVNLQPHLRPGRNVIALHELLRVKDYTPICWLAGAVQVADGKTIPIQTDETWKANVRAEKGWLEAGFNDSHWLSATGRHPHRPYLGYAPAALPSYSGQLLLANPDGRKLVFDQSRPVRLHVRVPPGLSGRCGPLRYAVWRDGQSRPVARGECHEQPASCYAIDAGHLARGVYTLVLDAGKGKNPQQARQEVLLVTGRIPMPRTEGRRWDEGMRLTLVDQIDCTDPRDPHLFRDAGCVKTEYASRVVSRGGLTYREVRSSPGNQHSWFGYHCRFAETLCPYWIEIDYPDDAERLMEIQCSPRHARPGGWEEVSWVGAGVRMGGVYPSTGRMQTFRMLVWPGEQEGVILITSAEGRSAPVAAARIRIQKINDLPELAVRPGGRRFGLMTERASVLERSFGGVLDLNSLPAGVNPYRAWFEQAEGFARYCRFTGQNAHFMGSYQYTYGNPPIVVPSDGSEAPSLLPECREVYVPVLGANGIETFGAVEFRTDIRAWHEGWFAPHQVIENGADLMFQVDRRGRPRGGHYNRDNPMASPAAMASFRRAMEHIARRFAVYPSWKGIAVLLAPGWQGPVYDSADVSFDDQTIRLFEKETGNRVPVAGSDPARFARRYERLVGRREGDPAAWRPAALSQAWFDWRSEKVAQVHDEVAAVLRRVRPDLEYSVTVEYPVEEMYARGRSALEVMRDVGYDPRAYRQRKQYSFGRDIWSYAPIAAGRAIGLRQWLRDEEVIRLLGDGSGLDRWTLVRTGFHEWAIGALAGPTGTKAWDSPLHGTGYFVSHAAPAHRSWAERFLRSVIDNDVDTMQYGFCDSVCPAGEEQQMQRFLRAYRSLPRARFRRLTGPNLGGECVIAESRAAGKYWIYLANPGPFDMDVAMTLSGSGTVLRAADGQLLAAPDGKLLLRLESYELLPLVGTEDVLRPNTAAAQATDWSRRYVEQSVRLCQEMLRDPARIQRLTESSRAGACRRLDAAVAALAAGQVNAAWDHLAPVLELKSE
jgi:hypothetical protein